MNCFQLSSVCGLASPEAILEVVEVAEPTSLSLDSNSNSRIFILFSFSLVSSRGARRLLTVDLGLLLFADGRSLSPSMEIRLPFGSMSSEDCEANFGLVDFSIGDRRVAEIGLLDEGSTSKLFEPILFK